MAQLKPFAALRPAPEYVQRVAALPYDVYNRKEAAEEAQKDPLSFLNIDRPETQFPPETDMYADYVYEKAAEMLQNWQNKGILIRDKKPCFYLYELTMGKRSQTGVVGCASIDDYQNNVIKKHENTRAEKEADRIRHVDVCDAQTGPIFLAYHSETTLEAIISQWKQSAPVYDFVSEDGVGHRIWIIDDESVVLNIQKQFESMTSLYIADGHHRAASAVKVGLKRRREMPDYTGAEPFNYFLSVLFPDNELKILPYYRVIQDLNGLTKEAFLSRCGENFEIRHLGEKAFEPSEKGTFGCYLEHEWYCFKAKNKIRTNDCVSGLDVSLLQDYILSPILGIDDPKTDKRIDFVGGIRGIQELERRCHADMCLAFSTYATSIGELFNVADAGRLMPPKSTWFEPKLRSGIFIHELNKKG